MFLPKPTFLETAMPKIISPVTPWLIQRCKLESGKLRYDYMGSSEFEWGDQAKALKKLFAGKVVLLETTVQASDGGATVPVCLIAQDGFDVSAYQQHLQQLADDKLHLKEYTRFGEVVNFKATGKMPQFGVSEYDIWFDFTEREDEQNIVLWTIDHEKRDALLARLKEVTDGWANKKKPD